MTDLAALPSLPVRVPIQWSLETNDLMATGATEFRGLLRADGETLVLEVRPHGALGDGDLAEHRVALADVSDVAFASRWWRTRLTLRPRRLAAFAGIPGLVQNELRLTVPRGDRGLASRWATALSLALLDREA